MEPRKIKNKKKRRYTKNVLWNEEINKRCRKVIVVKRPLFMMQFSMQVLRIKKNLINFLQKYDLCNFYPSMANIFQRNILIHWNVVGACWFYTSIYI